MNRDDQLAALTDASLPWDVIVIGGGATGLGIALDSTTRGYRTLLVEQSDFAKGTSSRSTKLIHGGVRYLKQGNVGLVLEALRERGLLTQNAPHLVSHLGFIVPNYTWWEAPFYGVGLKIYDLLAGKLGLGPSRVLSRKQTLKLLPTLEPRDLRGGTMYYDGQFDDARLAITLAQTAVDHGAVLLNYFKVTALLKENDLVQGLRAQDLENSREHELRARVVINATGVFCDQIRRMDDSDASPVIVPSQGVHIVLDNSFLPGPNAIMVPKTDDGRVLFAIPWHNRTLIGTTDTPVATPELEPRPLADEIQFLLVHAARYLTKDPQPDDVLSTFAGLRPLVRPSDQKETSTVPRDHSVLVSASGLVSVTGGKWTTYRKMAEDTVDQAAIVADLEDRPSQTKKLRLHGWCQPASNPSALDMYGSDAPSVKDLLAENPEWNEPLHPELPYRTGEVIWAIRNEMARTIEDALSRRTRALLLNARATIEIAPKVARLFAQELGRNTSWEKAQLQSFLEIANGYHLGENCGAVRAR